MKHAAATIWDTVEPGSPKHSAGWGFRSAMYDRAAKGYPAYFISAPGRHAKPFAAHHPARPVTYDATGATTPLNPPTNVLDAVA